MSPRNATTVMERLFAGLADPTRLRLLNLIAGQEVCVCDLVKILKLPQPKISRHLAYLRRARLVAARREGKWMHYHIAVPENAFARRLLADTLRWLREDMEMQHDRARLPGASCAPQKIVRLQGAPAPTRVVQPVNERA